MEYEEHRKLVKSLTTSYNKNPNNEIDDTKITRLIDIEIKFIEKTILNRKKMPAQLEQLIKNLKEMEEILLILPNKLDATKLIKLYYTLPNYTERYARSLLNQKQFNIRLYPLFEKIYTCTPEQVCKFIDDDINVAHILIKKCEPNMKILQRLFGDITIIAIGCTFPKDYILDFHTNAEYQNMKNKCYLDSEDEDEEEGDQNSDINEEEVWLYYEKKLRIEMINYVISKGIIPDFRIFQKICDDEHEEYLDIYLQIVTNITMEHLNTVCKTANYDFINKILQYKIIPTKESYNAIFTRYYKIGNAEESESDEESWEEVVIEESDESLEDDGLEDEGTEDENFEVVIDNKYPEPCRLIKTTVTEQKKKKLIKIIELLISFGLKLDQDDILKAMDYQIGINDINRFNIKLDQHYIDKSTKLSFYPYNKSDFAEGINYTLADIKSIMAKHNNFETLKKFINDFKLELDSECLVIACSRAGNIKLIKYLITNKKLVPTIECLRAAYNLCGNMEVIRFLTEKCGLQADKQCLLNAIDKNTRNKVLKYIASKY